MSLLDEVVARVGKLDNETKAKLAALTEQQFTDVTWIPNVGPQADAFESPAYVLLYGGKAGGGKSALLTGLALTRHKRSLLMRRQYTDLGALIEDTLKQYGSRKGYSGTARARLRTEDGRLIEFGAAKLPGDDEHWRGQPHDLLCIDEATQFLESQVRFLMGWVRTTEKDQRCRVILASNPPDKPGQGQWLFDMFKPWLDPLHPNPAKPGELRWYVSDGQGTDQEVDGPEAVTINGRETMPLSRTFIPADVADNPYLAATDYQAKLDALPEPLHSAVRDGNWTISHRDDEFQIIPTAWVMAAQARWTPDPPSHAPMCAIGVDVARGGTAKTVLAARYDFWFAELVVIPGSETPLGTDVAAQVVKHRRNNAVVIIDMGGGYGGAPYEHLKHNLAAAPEGPRAPDPGMPGAGAADEPNYVGVPGGPIKHLKTTLEGAPDGTRHVVFAYNGANASKARTADRQLGFFNKRAESWWRLREALDPDQENGSPLALPPDAELAADLVAAHWRLTPRGIQVENKNDIVKRLGRSPDRGDAMVMAWSEGAMLQTHEQIWRKAGAAQNRSEVKRGYAGRKKLYKR